MVRRGDQNQCWKKPHNHYKINSTENSGEAYLSKKYVIPYHKQWLALMLSRGCYMMEQAIRRSITQEWYQVN